MNDLNKKLKFTHALLYSDDTTILATGQNLKCMSNKINKDLGTPSLWY